MALYDRFWREYFLVDLQTSKRDLVTKKNVMFPYTVLNGNVEKMVERKEKKGVIFRSGLYSDERL